MNKEQTLGQVRAFLSALAGVLIAFGLKDGHGWEPTIGIAMLGVSLTWGLYHKEGWSSVWSVARKLLNALGAAAATYGFLTPEKAEAMVGLVGPIISIITSWKANGDGSTKPPTGLALPLIMAFGISMCFFSSGCAVHVNPDGSKDVIIMPPEHLTIGVFPQK